MALVFMLLFLVSATFLLVGLFVPEGSLFWYKGRKTRGKSSIIYGVAALLSMIISIATSPDLPRSKSLASSDNLKSKTQVEKDSLAAEQVVSSDAVSVDSAAIQAPVEQPLLQEIRNVIKSIDGGDDLTSFTKGDMQDASMFNVAIGILHAPYETIKKGQLSSDAEITKATAELEKKAIASQKKNFPLLRKDYFTFIKNKLWEEDIDVALSGSRNTTLTFTGGVFVKNKNIKEFNESLYEMLRLLRFQKTQYRWYRSGDLTFYNLNSSKDGELVKL